MYRTPRIGVRCYGTVMQLHRINQIMHQVVQILAKPQKLIEVEDLLLFQCSGLRRKLLRILQNTPLSNNHFKAFAPSSPLESNCLRAFCYSKFKKKQCFRVSAPEHSSFKQKNPNTNPFPRAGERHLFQHPLRVVSLFLRSTVCDLVPTCISLT